MVKSMKAKVHITLKNGVLDPQGKAIEGALSNMGFSEIADVRQGKYIELSIKESDRQKAEAMLDKICSSLLANTVVENYRYELL